jgi:excinuclease ABC subunit C
MKKLSDQQKYEEAARIRDQLSLIKEVFSQKHISLRNNFFIKNDNNEALQDLWKTLAPYINRRHEVMPNKPFHRIEAYDISNLSKEDATASMVVLINGISDNKEYRYFKIRYVLGINDVEMIKEVVYRRFKHYEWSFPDLLVIDGGKGQVQAARTALSISGLQHKIPVIGLAKANNDIIIKKYKFHQILLPKSSPALLLLMRIRDESHRFARVLHHRLRDKRY